MYEYAPDHLTADLYPKQDLPKYREMQRQPNRIAFASFIEDPRDSPRHALQVFGGAQAEVGTGKSTEVRRFVATARSVRGLVVTSEDGKPVSSGKVIVRGTRGNEQVAKYEYKELMLKNGTFASELTHPAARVKAFYIPAPRFGDSESKDLRVRSYRGAPASR
jgi:hypothetical protein